MSLEDKIKKAKQEAKERKFIETFDLAVNLSGVDLSNPKNRINEEIILPNGRGKEMKIGVFGSEEMKLKARDHSDFIFGVEDIGKFSENKKEFKKIVNQVEFFISESTLMANIGKSLGTVLGPRGKIPRPLPPGQDPVPVINNLKKTVRVRSRDRRTFHVPIGSKNMKEKEVADNIREVMKRIVSKLEKGYGNIESIYIKTTMGPAIKIEEDDLR